MAILHGSWVKLDQTGILQGARSSHAIAVVGQKVYAFGGEFEPRVPVDNKLHVYDLDTLTWSVADVSGSTPPPRVGVTMAAVGETIYVFGGRDAEHNELNELYSFDTKTNNWALISSGDVGPPNRSYHSMTADDRRVYVFGGCGVAGRLNDLWAFDVVDGKWVEFPSPGESCKGRGGPGLTVAQGKIWVVYGFAGMEVDDVHFFDLAQKTWAQVETSGLKPTARSVFSTCLIGKHIIVYGGEIDPSDQGHMGAGQFSGELYALDTETLSWTRLDDKVESGDHPGPRGWCAFAGASRGSQEGLLVYGGNSPSNDRLDDIFFLALAQRNAQIYDRKSELKEFDESKVGVQGLIENGVTKVPRMFYCEQSNINHGSVNESNSKLSVPTIDLTGIHDDPVLRDEVVRKVQNASEKWGFFQVINHGIPVHVLDEMVKGTRRFHQQDAKVRKEYYTRDLTKKVVYLSNFTLYQDQSADWRDTLAFFWAPDPPKADELPPVCSDIVNEYTKEVMELGSSLYELLSEALGLNRFHLKEMGGAESFLHLCHYYPPCPEPELTIGTTKHSDASFITVLLQDHIGGLQILHDNQWIDLPPIHGALVVNIGDLLQLVSNDKFTSVQHRVLAKSIGPRISAATLFRTENDHSPEGIPKVIGPIKELLSEENPPMYRDTSLKEYLAYRFSNGLGASALSPFKLLHKEAT